MCNKRSTHLSESKNSADQQYYHQSPYLMGSRSSTSPSGPGSATSSIDDSRRVKFLCSFLGSIMPRPQDGKLRYVGGETRIVSVLRDICYEDLMSKLRELYEEATVLKYQQPDEDLDALVSVVNDDDVVNMMEEYDKFGSCDSFTKLRLFLFSHSDHDGAVHFIDGDDRKTEGRYVDALNNLNDTCELRKQQLDDIALGIVEDIHAPEQFISRINVDGRLQSQRSGDLPLLPYNLGLNIPHMGSGQHQLTLPVSNRCNDVDMSWSSGYYSPNHHGLHDPRSLAEFPSSPSATMHRFPFLDSPTEEYTTPQVSHQPVYEHQPPYPDNNVWYPPGVMPNEKAGFPGNILHGLAFERNSTGECCRVSYLRGQPHLEHLNLVNGSQQVANPCAECHSNRENFVLTADTKLHPVIYGKEQSNDSRSEYNVCQSHERGRFVDHLINNQVEEATPHVVASGRLNDRHIVDSPSLNFSVGQGDLAGGILISSSYTHLQNGSECGSEVFRDQTGFSGSHVRISRPEDGGVQCGNTCYAYTGDNHYNSQHGPVPGQGLWRNSPVHVGPVYEAFGAIQQVNGTVNPGIVRTEGSPRFYLGSDNQGPCGDSSQKILEYEGKLIPDYPNTHALKPNIIRSHDKQQPIPLDPNHPPINMANMEYIPFLVSSSNSIQNKGTTVMPDVRNDNATGVLGTSPCAEDKVPQNVNKVEVSNVQCDPSYAPNKVAENVGEPAATVESSPNKKSADNGNACKAEKDKSAPTEGLELSVNNLSFVPELIASIKKEAVEGAEEVKVKVEEHDSPNIPDETAKETTTHEPELNDKCDVILESENENINASRIEPTKAEAEAISRGLQTIKNDDLEEVRELGSGTYGAVHHGKWKGSDVAIKRIKASCFAGRPSERERLIADFWKEALILSSLHHPNVVSFYGIVRDGPDGALATVTEFMINGSLKQFLQKKDRTIDRRKRLIIAMDAAFGMEYLHGKNIVHFDLKCENLLVNMRDPQRPVCKIGDLGLSKVKQHTLVSGGVRGTLPWMAPELLSGKSSMVTEKIDVYSFGIVMWELLTGEEPYADMHCASLIGGIVSNTLRPQIPAWCDPEWKSLMESCWASDPPLRPSFSDISQKLRSMAAAMKVK